MHVTSNKSKKARIPQEHNKLISCLSFPYAFDNKTQALKHMCIYCNIIKRGDCLLRNQSFNLSVPHFRPPESQHGDNTASIPNLKYQDNGLTTEGLPDIT